MTNRLLPRKRLLGTIATAAAGAILIGGAYTSPLHNSSAPSTLLHTQTVASTTISGNISLNLGANSTYVNANRYNDAINQIRNRVRQASLYDSVIAERPSNTNDYFALHLQDYNDNSQISLVMNTANLYVVGFYNHEEDTYYRMGAGPANPVGAGTVSNDYLPDGGYSYLTSAQAGNFNRSTQAISLGSIRGAIASLRSDSSSQESDARAITLLITAFAEAARFDYISSRTNQAIQNSESWALGSTGVQYTNRWSNMSGYLRSRLQDGASVSYNVDTTHFSSLQQIAAQLAVAYMAYNWAYSAP